jgi:preprotein translocase subunit Sss1
VYPVFALLLLALAGCTVLVVRRRGAAISEEALGFAVIGAVGLGLVAVAVLVVGRLSVVPGRAEGLALLGLGGFVIYLLAAWVVLRWASSPRRR